MSLHDLPAVNATLNGISAVLLTAGFILIKRKNRTAHRNCMLGALVASTLFLACYLYYHFHAGRTVFKDPAWFRPIYLALLLTHTTLAVAWRKRLDAVRPGLRALRRALVDVCARRLRSL